jgi:hypothetical protein
MRIGVQSMCDLLYLDTQSAGRFSYPNALLIPECSTVDYQLLLAVIIAVTIIALLRERCMLLMLSMLCYRSSHLLQPTYVKQYLEF